MIEKMKKLTLIVTEKERDSFIQQLRTAGVLHIKPSQSPVSCDINTVVEQLTIVDRAISILTPYNHKLGSVRDSSDAAYVELSRTIANKHSQLEELDSLRKTLEAQLNWYSGWGTVSLEDIKRFEQKGIFLSFYKTSPDEYKRIKGTAPIITIKKEKHLIWFVEICYKEPSVLPFEKIELPEISYQKLKADLEKISVAQQGIFDYFTANAAYFPGLQNYQKKMQANLKLLQVKHGMHEESQFSYVQGYCPEKFLKVIIEVAEKSAAGYVIEPPDDVSDTPVYITNPKWIRIIDPIFKFMNTFPGYDEHDVSLVFLIFFSIFFAMLIGDAGYGLLFLGITFLVRQKYKTAPSEPFFLLYTLSILTIIWGAITGSWFGFEKIAQLPFFNSLIIAQLSSFSEGSRDNIISLCFLLGAIQLTIAHILKGLRIANSIKVLAQLGWISIIWGMFFAAGTLVLGNPFPAYGGGLLITGIGLVLIFANFQKNIIKGSVSILPNLILDVISSFSDVVSYLRLFAVGYASAIMSASFNEMALAGGVDSMVSGLIAATILFLGHSLNIILGFMAVIVHGVRLNMLEFSGHLGISWNGKYYQPFDGIEHEREQKGENNE
ncbi:MAG TPA: hypothetical protein DHV24_04140 [Candidatus Margulisbacteria bacterium]|nr:hypothetical protein [Candidatus Margulisiibacteriota bacterium]